MNQKFVVQNQFDRGISYLFAAIGLMGVVAVVVMSMQSSHHYAQTASQTREVQHTAQIDDLGN